MRNACREALSALAALIVSSAAIAQTYPNGLSADSVDPGSDARYIHEMQLKMDKIHKMEKRPTVALVLSGGGAKGAAHVGVLHKLEEMEIPVDLICGTSMGGLVGGLYAMGYSADYLDSLLRNQNWDFTLTDKVDQSHISYSAKEYKSKYLVSIPFHYEKDSRTQPEEIYSSSDGKINIDAGSGDLETQSGVSDLASSLPSGYVYGFNVNNLISSLTVGYQDSISFSTLPIPYYSVSADVISCKAKNWGSGSVKSAIRSTMSIPGMFDPVRTGGMVLVDGGVRNNFPVDIARAMGADYVIGVELSGEAPDYDQINNLGNILMQFIKMLGKDAFDKNTPNVDVFIRPDVAGYNMLSFSEEAIDTLITRGYVAASSHEDELQAIKNLMPEAKMKLNNKAAIDINANSVLVSSIAFNGLSDDESRMLMDKIGLRVGTYLNKKDMDTAMSRLQATGSFESVTYSLFGVKEPFRLEFDCVKAPTHKVGLGFRLDSYEYASFLLNLGLNTNKLKGSKFDMEARIGVHRFLKMRYSLDLPGLPTINAEAKLVSNYGDVLSGDGLADYNITMSSRKESFYISNINWTRVDLRLGVENDNIRTKNILSGDDMVINFKPVDKYVEKYISGDFASAFIDARIYTLDNKYFPTKGLNFIGNAKWTFGMRGQNEFKPFPTIALAYKQVIPLGQPVSFIFDINTRNIFTDEAPLGFANVAGGSIAGHYLEQHIPFAGFHQTYLGDTHMAIANAELRVNAFKNFYISALGGILQQGSSLSEELTSFDNAIIGGGLQAAYNTVFGPIKADVTWCTLEKKPGFFISAGFDF